MNIFEYASRAKIRFPFKGLIATEDLWDLTLAQLDFIFKTLNEDVKQTQEESLLDRVPAMNEELYVKLEIVKYVFAAKQESLENSRAAAAKAEKKQRILEVLAKKQDDSLNNMSEEDLKRMLEDFE